MRHKRGLVLNPRDNVANVLEEIRPGETVELRLDTEILSIKATEQIPFGFKMAIADIAVDAPVIKYGEPIGRASQPIERGALVHVHNLAGARGRGDLRTKGEEKL